MVLPAQRCYNAWQGGPKDFFFFLGDYSLKGIPKLKNNFFIIKPLEYYNMYGFFPLKKSKFVLKLWLIVFFFIFENKHWVSKSSATGNQNRVLPGVIIKCIHTKSLFVWMHSIWPLVHSILTPGSTRFWPPAAPDFDPQGLFSKLKKLEITTPKGIWIFWRKPYIL